MAATGVLLAVLVILTRSIKALRMHVTNTPSNTACSFLKLTMRVFSSP